MNIRIALCFILPALIVIADFVVVFIIAKAIRDIEEDEKLNDLCKDQKGGTHGNE